MLEENITCNMDFLLCWLKKFTVRAVRQSAQIPIALAKVCKKTS